MKQDIHEDDGENESDGAAPGDTDVSLAAPDARKQGSPERSELGGKPLLLLAGATISDRRPIGQSAPLMRQ